MGRCDGRQQLREEDPDFDVTKAGSPPELKPAITVNDLRSVGERKQKMLYDLSRFVRTCTMCPLGEKSCMEHKSEFDPHVFSSLTPSRWMVVGQNPGFNECIHHKPFVGQAGKFFDDRLTNGGVARSKLYVTNVVKCHTIDNERPTMEQVQKCEQILRLEISILNPILVITLGAVPFEAFCPKSKYGDSLGKIMKSDRFGVNVFPIYHPSPRNVQDLGRRAKFMKDVSTLCKLMKKVQT